MVEDLLGTSVPATIASQTSGASNAAAIGVGGLTLPDSELIQHPGLASVTTTTVGYVTLAVASNMFPMTNASGLSATFTMVFRTPSLVSDATNTYTFYVGALGVSASGVPKDGVGLSYSNAVNSGAWQGFTASAGTLTSTPTTTTFVAATWYILRLVASNLGWSVFLNETQILQLNDAPWSGGTKLTVSAGSMLMNKTAAPALTGITSAVALMDRVSVYMTGLTR